MKTMIAMAAVLLLVGGVHMQHSSVSAEPVRGTWTGIITSSNCGMMHMHGMTDRDCTRACVKDGAEYVLVANGEVYRFASQDDEKLHAHAGAAVTVAGELRGDTLVADTIEARR
jgi:hypothetical protein